MMRLPEKDLWQTAKQKNKVVIYGTGDGADKIIDRLQADGTQIEAVCCGNDFVRDRSFRGYHVISVADAVERYPDALFLLAFGTKLPEVILRINAVAGQVELRSATVPVYGDEIFDMRYFELHKQELRAAFALLADEQSRRVFENAVRFYLTGELPLLFASDSEKSEAFERILKLGERESYLDIGAYRGDTAEEFISFTKGKYQSITALEPDEKTFRKLRENLAGYPNTKAVHAGAWDKTERLAMQTGRGRGSHTAETGELTDFIAPDDFFADERVTYLKIDAEGAEKQVLDGARHILQSQMPKLNIAAYHRTGDLFRLILQLHCINPNYGIYLRKHRHIPFWDLNIYAAVR